MSKKSKERRKRMMAERAEVLAKEVNGNTVDSSETRPLGFAERAAAIIKEDQDKRQVPMDKRLPMHYMGGAAQSNGYAYGLGKIYPSPNPSVSQSYTYKTVDNYEDRSILKVVSKDITEGACPIAKVPKVYVSARLWGEWINLAGDMDKEWLAYLVGRFVKDDKGSRYEISKCYFPPQTATPTHVDVDDDFSSYQPNTIGAVHSHVGMGTFFSGEDLAHSNWPVEIVVNNKGEVKVMIRHQLECGQYIKSYTDLMTTGDNADSRYVAALNKAMESGQALKDARLAAKYKSIGYRTPDVKALSQPIIQTVQTVQTVSQSTVQPVNSIVKQLTTKEPLRSIKPNEWPFKINGKPSKWSDDRNCWVEVVYMDNVWMELEEAVEALEAKVDKQDALLEDGTDTEAAETVPMPMISLSMAEQDRLMDESIEIDEATGQIIDSGSGTVTSLNTDDGSDSDEIEIEGDCPDCEGTGLIEIDAESQIICRACDGSGFKPDSPQGQDKIDNQDGRQWPHGFSGYEDYTC